MEIIFWWAQFRLSHSSLNEKLVVMYRQLQVLDAVNVAIIALTQIDMDIMFNLSTCANNVRVHMNCSAT